MQVAINWTTQYEGNYTNFTVERNDNGNTLNAIGALHPEVLALIV